MTDIWDALRAPFPPNVVSWRVGATNQEKTKGLALAYIDARDVMERLDTVVGPENWENRYPHAGQKTVCEIGIKIDGAWIYKADGAGDTDTEAEKGALSDAFKRAAVRWGIGRYLYDVDSPWVELEPRGRSYIIKESEKPKLLRLLSNAPAPVAVQKKTTTPVERARLNNELETITRYQDLSTWYARNTAAIEGLADDDKDIFRNSYIDKQRELKAALAA